MSSLEESCDRGYKKPGPRDTYSGSTHERGLACLSDHLLSSRKEDPKSRTGRFLGQDHQQYRDIRAAKNRRPRFPQFKTVRDEPVTVVPNEIPFWKIVPTFCAPFPCERASSFLQSQIGLDLVSPSLACVRPSPPLPRALVCSSPTPTACRCNCSAGHCVAGRNFAFPPARWIPLPFFNPSAANPLKLHCSRWPRPETPPKS